MVKVIFWKAVNRTNYMQSGAFQSAIQYSAVDYPFSSLRGEVYTYVMMMDLTIAKGVNGL